MKMFDKIKEAHQRYVDWWLPIDVANGSLLAPMCCLRFCEYLLIFPDSFFQEWINEEDKNEFIKRHILNIIVAHHMKIIDLNKD